MDRSVACRIEADVRTPADLVLSVAVAAGIDCASEDLHVLLDGESVSTEEVVDQHGTRLHLVHGLGEGRLVVDYRATTTGGTTPPPVEELDAVRYLRPSRYCESDTLGPIARDQFGDPDGFDLVAAVSEWVSTQLVYEASATRPTDGAVATLLARQGVCRDYAHLVVALLRALDVPARLVSVYAPGLHPMDFHAVAEALVDGEWTVTDATRMAPRPAMVRIATGRDAADTAFMTTHGGVVDLDLLEVLAVTAGDLPVDDGTHPARLGDDPTESGVP